MRKVLFLTFLVTIISVANVAGVRAADSLSIAAQARLATIKSRGDAEIGRRLASLDAVLARINDMARLTEGDKAALRTEANATITGLTTLKTQLDAATTLETARTSAQSIIDDYRVYALVLPKAWLVRVADAQLGIEDKLLALASKLQTRITTAKDAGKDVFDLQQSLDDMTAKTKAAQVISQAVEQAVLPLKPTDFNANHAVLVSQRAQLQIAQTDIRAARDDTTSIIAVLKGL